MATMSMSAQCKLKSFNFSVDIFFFWLGSCPMMNVDGYFHGTWGNGRTELKSNRYRNACIG